MTEPWTPSDELVKKCARQALTAFDEFPHEWRYIADEVLKAAVASGELVPREWLEEFGWVGENGTTKWEYHQPDSGPFPRTTAGVAYPLYRIRIHPPETDTETSD